jgi:deoxyribodipyrimidine photo-lyase
VAGCGADAAPYFRVFNPVLQGEKFDREGDYVRRWIPELKALPSRWIHRPWEAPALVLKEAGIRLNSDYPLPCIPAEKGRSLALAAYAQMKASSPSHKDTLA